MKKIKIVTALLLALLLAIHLPMSAYAAETKSQYISEVKIGYGDAGKEALKEAGYTVRDDLNLNPGGEGDDVWLGYKTTLNQNEAITDMALMNQGTGYKFQGWSEELDALQEEISALIDRFEIAIKEYQANLKAGSPYAVQAKKLLNMFKDDDLDTATTDETGYFLGDLLEEYGTLSATGETKVTKDNLVTIFMQGNATTISTVKYYLAYACTEYSADYAGETFVDRLADYECTNEIEPNVVNKDRAAVMSAIQTARTTVLSFEKMQADVVKQYGSEETYFNTLSKSKKVEYTTMQVFYETLKTTAYTSNLDNGEFTLLDLLELPTEYVDDVTPFLEDYLLDPLVKCLTPGQLAMIDTVGFQSLFTMAVVATSKESSEKFLQEEEKMYSSLQKEFNGEVVSVYDGVDRQLFYDRDTIALTSKAIMDKAQSAGADFGKKTEKSKEVNTTLRNIAIGFGAFAGVCFGLTIASYASEVIAFYNFAPSGLIDSIHIVDWFASGGVFSDEAFGAIGSITANTFRTFMTVIGAVAIVVALVLTIITLVQYFEDDDDEEEIITFTYDQIPRVLMDLRYKGEGNTEKYYVPYYAAETITPAEKAKTVTKTPGSEESLSKYGDLNGLCGKCAWLTLYTTKDTQAGTPLLADFKVSTDSTIPDGYQGLHMFSNPSAANLNQLQLNNASAIYVFAKLYADSTGTGSVFTENAGLLHLCGLGIFILGAGIAMVATAGYYRKKEKKIA